MKTLLIVLLALSCTTAYAQTMSPSWIYPTSGSIGAVYSSPSVARGNAFVGSDDGHLYCITAAPPMYENVSHPPADVRALFTNLPPSSTILVYSPHPDDCEMDMGSLIRWLTRQGHLVYNVLVTDGEYSQYVRYGYLSAGERLAEKRLAQIALGVPLDRQLELHLADGGSDAEDWRQTLLVRMRELEQLYNPAITFGPFVYYPDFSGESGHRDHRRTGWALHNTDVGTDLKIYYATYQIMVHRNKNGNCGYGAPYYFYSSDEDSKQGAVGVGGAYHDNRDTDGVPPPVPYHYGDNDEDSYMTAVAFFDHCDSDADADLSQFDVNSGRVDNSVCTHWMAPGQSCSTGWCRYEYFFTNPGNIYPPDLVWKYPAGTGIGSPIRGRPAIYNEHLYFGADNGKLYCLDCYGAETWVTQVCAGPIRSAPAVTQDGYVYVAANDGRLYKLRVSDGSLTEYSAPILGQVASSPMVFADYVWVGAEDGSVYALSSGGMVVRWSLAMGAPVSAAPVVDAASANPHPPSVYLCSEAGNLEAVDPVNAQLRWGPKSLGAASSSTPFVDISSGILYVGDSSHRLYAINISTGAVQPGYPYKYSGTGSILSSPLPAARAGGAKWVYFGGGVGDTRFWAANAAAPSSCYYYNASSGEFLASPAVSGDSIYDVIVAGNTNGCVYGFSLK